MVLGLKPIPKKKKKKFWTEPRPCMVLGLKPMGKPSTQKSFGQNQGLAWSSDSSLWGNQVLKKFWTEPRPCMVLGLKPMGKPSTQKKVLDRTKTLRGPRTQAYGETKYSKKFGTEPRPCMVLGLKPMGKPSTQKSFGHNQGLAWSSDSSLWENQLPGWESPRLKYCKVLRPIRVLG